MKLLWKNRSRKTDISLIDISNGMIVAETCGGIGRSGISWSTNMTGQIVAADRFLCCFDKSGAAVHEWELDHRVCDCCQTSSAMTTGRCLRLISNVLPRQV